MQPYKDSIDAVNQYHNRQQKEKGFYRLRINNNKLEYHQMSKFERFLGRIWKPLRDIFYGESNTKSIAKFLNHHKEEIFLKDLQAQEEDPFYSLLKRISIKAKVDSEVDRIWQEIFPRISKQTIQQLRLDEIPSTRDIEEYKQLLEQFLEQDRSLSKDSFVKDHLDYCRNNEGFKNTEEIYGYTVPIQFIRDIDRNTFIIKGKKIDHEDPREKAKEVLKELSNQGIRKADQISKFLTQSTAFLAEEESQKMANAHLGISVMAESQLQDPENPVSNSVFEISETPKGTIEIKHTSIRKLTRFNSEEKLERLYSIQGTTKLDLTFNQSEEIEGKAEVCFKQGPFPPKVYEDM